MSKLTSIQTLLAIAAKEGLHVRQLDFETAYLNGLLEEEIYMKPPPGLPGVKPGMVWWLKKSLYGLKQAGRVWNDMLNAELKALGFQQCDSDFCVYTYGDGDNKIHLTVYVDDMIMVGRDLDKIQALQGQLGTKFKIKDLGKALYILGIQITHNTETGKIFLLQEKYICDIAERFRMSKAKSAPTPLNSGIKLSKDDCPRTQEEKEDMANVPCQSQISSCAARVIAIYSASVDDNATVG